MACTLSFGAQLTCKHGLLQLCAPRLNVRAFTSCHAQRKEATVCSAGSQQKQQQQQQPADFLSRRAALLALSVAPLLSGIASPASAESGQLTEYKDGTDEFELMVPADWVTGEGQAEGARFGGSSGARRALAWYPEGRINDANISVVITNVGADFTKLGSFGTASAFAENLVASMDRSYLKNARWGNNKEPIQEAHLLAANDRNAKNGSQLYFITYDLLKPGEDTKRIFQTAVSLGFNGRYNRLFTLTAQCKESDKESIRLLEKAVSSFTPPVPVV